MRACQRRAVAGVAEQSTFLMVQLASHGFVVAAPEHVGNTFGDIPPPEEVERRKAAHLEARRHRPHDLVAVFRALTAAGGAGHGLPRCRADAVGVAGHSFGGWTAIKLAALRLLPVRAVLALAPAAEPFVGRGAFAPGDLPLPADAATLVIASDLDCMVSLDASVRSLAARLGPQHRLVIMQKTDHYHYCDHAADIHNMRTAGPPQEGQLPSLPFDQLVPEERTAGILCAAATALFRETLLAHRAPATVLGFPWAALDPCIRVETNSAASAADAASKL